ncbi:MAG: cell division protein FtsZ, partial [Cytophagaceae bacterium]|nr:cell division protein FtsZ [Cytophagaceae bacterium]
FGQGIEASLGANIKVTVIATGFTHKEPQEVSKKVFDLESDKQINLFSNEYAAKKPVVNNFYFEKPKEQQPEIKPEPKKEEPKQERTLFSLEEPMIIKHELKEEPTPEPQPENKVEYVFEIKKETKPEDEERKKYMLDQAQERIKKLKGLSSNITMNPEEFKEKLEVPAYLRKNVNLQDYPHSSERNISRFNLNDENEILGNNKFLHDNVD